MLNKRILVLMFLLVFLSLVGCFPPPTNQAPILTSDPITTATVGVLYTYNVNATDPDDDALTYSLIIKPSAMIINSVTGVIFWTPIAAQVGNNSVIVKISDGSLSITQPFKIKVSKPTPTPINHEPDIYSTPVTTATVGSTYVYDVNATDPDGDTLIYSLTTKPSGMFINSVNGLIWWVPSSVQVGNNLVTVNVSDGALSDTQSFIIKVSEPSVPPTNQAPIIISTQITIATVGVTYIYDVEAFDPDGDALTYSLAVKPPGMTISSANGVIIWIPTLAQVGNNNVTVKASDGKLSTPQSFTIVVSELPPVNQAPVIYSIPNLMAIVGVAFTYEVEAFDPDGDDLIYSLTDRPKGMEIESDTGKITWTPTSIQTGYNAVIVSVSDGDLSVTKYFTIIVDPVTLIGIEVDPEAMDLFIGKQRYITEITAHYNNETTAPVAPGDCTYRTNDSGVAEVDFNGLITAVAEGKATITITYKTDWRTFTDTIKVTVRKVPPPPVIDGDLSPGEWDDYYLGTSITDWNGGMSIDVYGYADDTYLYAAYVADMNEPGWSVGAGLCVSNNLYYLTPQSAGWPDPGYTLLAAGGYPDDVLQTDGSGWGNKGSFATNGVEIYSGDGCYNTAPNPNVAEVKIPLSLLTYAGDDGQIRLSGQYWQYDKATPFYVELPSLQN